MPSPGPAPAAYLFLAPGLLCLRLKETRRDRALLGHSLLSLVNRSVGDFVSEHDWPRVRQALEAARQGLAARLSHAPLPADPSGFQTQPLDRLIQSACAGACESVRAHLRTASGSYSLFDIDIYAGTVPGSAAEPALDEAYLICHITPFDVLGSLPALPRVAYPQPVGGLLHEIQMPTAKLHKCHHATRMAPPDPSALYLLAAVTDGVAAYTTGAPSPALSTPALSTPSPLLTASPVCPGALPSLSAMLRAIGADGPLGPLPAQQ
ncbi:hypothetical protein LPJ61_006477 [Coemansia biformis]|uniref:Uncharacterized protein n=1 Tax=Coemansia biformis TaxID=1286918 RepID=A0A9W7XUJ0_9FUNG|nr:hypothetical protein LPJ61_006477 [Coemansia biformis]